MEPKGERTVSCPPNWVNCFRVNMMIADPNPAAFERFFVQKWAERDRNNWFRLRRRDRV